MRRTLGNLRRKSRTVAGLSPSRHAEYSRRTRVDCGQTASFLTDQSGILGAATLRQLGEREVEQPRPSVASGAVRPAATMLAPAATSRVKRALDIALVVLVSPLV